MEAKFVKLNLEDEDEEVILCKKDSSNEKDEHRLCLVGKALTDCVMRKASARLGGQSGSKKIDVGAVGSKWGLPIGWKEEYGLQLKSFSVNHIDVEIMEKNECCLGDS
ncbi:hypothetical protein Goshw_012449 [Gossypium schwendimanii]|uniref:Uncharacterized protein n=1 Tax=Gossypium schwendimanii TaxID=34291 RepID=A0A7J9KRY1_GOSSC|nr:hypothetical protein [Gossypium schwendimanii]